VTGSDHIESRVLMRDPTLVARILLSGAAVEVPIITSTSIRPDRDGCGWFVTMELESVGVAMMQWVPTDELESTVRWMVTRAVAMQDKALLEVVQ